ncbi:MAG: CoA-binding protein [Pseudomonadota bacterium]
MPLVSRQDIDRVLSNTQTIALVGASPTTTRPSYRVMRFLLAHGYRVYPVNPSLAGQQLLEQTVYAQLSDIGHPIDMVDVFRQSRYLRAIVDEAVAIGAKTLWTQLGVIDDAAALAAEQAGLEVVMDRCPAIELPKMESASPS